MVASWDAIQAIMTIQGTFQGLRMTHVRGHRDRDVPPENLTLPETLNVEADRLAGEFQEDSTHLQLAMYLERPLVASRSLVQKKYYPIKISNVVIAILRTLRY